MRLHRFRCAVLWHHLHIGSMVNAHRDCVRVEHMHRHGRDNSHVTLRWISSYAVANSCVIPNKLYEYASTAYCHTNVYFSLVMWLYLYFSSLEALTRNMILSITRPLQLFFIYILCGSRHLLKHQNWRRDSYLSRRDRVAPGHVHCRNGQNEQ